MAKSLQSLISVYSESLKSLVERSDALSEAEVSKRAITGKFGHFPVLCRDSVSEVQQF